MPGDKTPGPGAVAGNPPAVKRKPSYKELKAAKKYKKAMRSLDFGKHPKSSSSTNPETDPGSSSKNPLSAAVRLLLQAPEGELEPTPAMTPGPQ